MKVNIEGLDFVYSLFPSSLLSISVFYYFLSTTHIHIQIQRQTYIDKQAYMYDNNTFSLQSKFLNPVSVIGSDFGKWSQSRTFLPFFLKAHKHIFAHLELKLIIKIMLGAVFFFKKMENLILKLLYRYTVKFFASKTQDTLLHLSDYHVILLFV